ncbi:MAG: preprotein translocase subunit SecE [Candidatus Terrybacteria bacterium RIFCSPLOWO2_01_FULL_58_14]|uniref:Protein translocase subunit SecE n=2 Tax=Candidatus Terryibacteriota TaxID=1817920 RepID=A0A1G2Q0S2_9BACT|nr:MAG: preprotein translocase subunit SecE [Candidatus Terrybacteria bacterium RIFCSPHIGHO2_01_FULL_58_15]OHA54165.1 MAG: preprotein translocase subunit SecE [Candidatus Terrybacteria bacterium RIFCSPLOWO2_01_FULL_58_14]
MTVIPGAIRGAASGLITYLVEARRELQKVDWPTRAEVIRMTAAVILLSGAVAMLLGGFDFLFERGVFWLLTSR